MEKHDKGFPGANFLKAEPQGTSVLPSIKQIRIPKCRVGKRHTQTYPASWRRGNVKAGDPRVLSHSILSSPPKDLKYWPKPAL